MTDNTVTAFKLLVGTLTPEQIISTFKILGTNIGTGPNSSYNAEGPNIVNPSVIADAKGSLPKVAQTVLAAVEKATPSLRSEFDAANDDPSARIALVDKYAPALFAVHTPQALAKAALKEPEYVVHEIMKRAIRYNQGELVAELYKAGAVSYNNSLDVAVAYALETKSPASLKALVDHFGIDKITALGDISINVAPKGGSLVKQFNADDVLRSIADATKQSVLEISDPEKVKEFEAALKKLGASGVVQINPYSVDVDGKIYERELNAIASVLDGQDIKLMTVEEITAAITQKTLEPVAAVQKQ